MGYSMEWINVNEQPPPKDGKSFLCFDPEKSGVEIYVVKYETICIKLDAHGNCLQKKLICKESGGEEYYTWDPTHWMPLPSPPSKKSDCFEDALPYLTFGIDK